MKSREWIYRFFVLWYGAGVILVALDLLPPTLEWANSVFLILAGLISIFFAIEKFGKKMGLFLSLFIFAASMFAESLGVHTGFPFGHYSYEQDFGVRIMGVPATIGFAWIFIIFSGLSMFGWLLDKKSFTYRLLYMAASSISAVLIDMVIDPVAFNVKQYWIWKESGLYYGIPVQNFLGWFFVSFIIQTGISYAESSSMPDGALKLVWENRLKRVYAMVLLMFILTAVIAQLYAAAIVGAAGLILLRLIIGRSDRFDYTKEKFPV
ncbi:carotenoid biosynthesis protein [Falsibacillus albus]|uniref:carotenoid biosynthesis protein n=1 Tax=Falsibacillus albus TaxID=2478915 RepID=UPI001314DF13|nr:carotenoid biosynthesis protein [Falsibacillus albus]